MDNLEKKLNYTFKDSTLLKTALTHKSSSGQNNERLEFLGDSILELVISKKLYTDFKNIDEGKLTRMRSSLVRGDTLCEIAKELALSKVLILGKGELKTGGFTRCSILEDALEAIFGTIFLEAGFLVVEKIILSIYKNRIKKLDISTIKDDKTLLQEYLQKYKLPLPKYKLIKTTGLDHSAIHTILCELSSPRINIERSASSVKYAEHSCAKELLREVVKYKVF